MRTMVFSAKAFEQPFFEEAGRSSDHEFTLIEAGLDPNTAPLAADEDAVCIFTNDAADEAVLERLAELGVKHVALRCAGFNQVDLHAAERLGITVARVPAYSPESVAEHALALILTLNRRTHRAYNRVREGNFALSGLMGFTLHGKTIGVVGTGRIGAALVEILSGFGCTIVAHDPYPDAHCEALGAKYIELDEVLERSDVISLNCPLTPETQHLIDDDAIARMQPGAMLINTSRGGLIDTDALIRGLKSRQLGSVGLDVYEEEADLFFRDLSETVIQDDLFARLLTFPNVLITAHQAFFTREAMESIIATTVRNLDGFANNDVPNENLVTTALLAK